MADAFLGSSDDEEDDEEEHWHEAEEDWQADEAAGGQQQDGAAADTEEVSSSDVRSGCSTSWVANLFKLLPVFGRCGVHSLHGLLAACVQQRTTTDLMNAASLCLRLF
jgi:hypothetical protein